MNRFRSSKQEPEKPSPTHDPKNSNPEDIEMSSHTQNTNGHPRGSSDQTQGTGHHILPIHKITKHIHPDGESGRRGFHILHFLRVIWASSSTISKYVNCLFPFVPAALALRYARPDLHIWVFSLNYIAMVPCANLLGFVGESSARKMPKVFGIVFETLIGSVVELILFMVLLKRDEFSVIQDAILGSILATLLLCLGACFFAGGLGRDEQVFDEAVSEVGSGLLLVAGFGLIVPSTYHASLGSTDALNHDVLQISRITSILLILAYVVYIVFQTQTHHGIYDAILEADEQRDQDRHIDLRKPKLTATECCLVLVIGLALVTLLAVSLVEEIPSITAEHGVSEAFMGLILVPLVEKAAEHLTAVDEAWDNQMNFALSHVLGATIQTALFNAPLVVIVAWGLNKDLDLSFQVFNIVVVILSILAVGHFLRDQKSNYLEGALCMIVYVIVAVGAFYYPSAEGDTVTVRIEERGI